MSELDDILAARVALLDRAPATFAEDVEKVTQRLFRAVLALAQELEQSGGKLTHSPRNVEFTLSMLSSLLDALDEAGYDEAARRYVDEYAEVVRLVRETYRVQDLPATFTHISRNAAEAARQMDLAFFDGLGQQAAREIQRSITQSTLDEMDYTSFVSRLRATITGTDRRGAPLATRANTFAGTAVSQFDALVTGQIADEAGVTHFKYYGPRDALTRPWCRRLLANNKPRTREEIEALSPSPTNTTGEGSFIGRGGFNCRHAWVPVPAPKEEEGA